MTDLREFLLAKENPATLVIDTKINEFDNMAIEILRIIELQRSLVTKCRQTWDKLLEDASRDINEIIPSVKRTPLMLESGLKQLLDIKKIMIQYSDQQENENYALAIHYKAKLTELLNKY